MRKLSDNTFLVNEDASILYNDDRKLSGEDIRNFQAFKILRQKVPKVTPLIVYLISHGLFRND